MKNNGLWVFVACSVFLIWTVSCQSPSSSEDPASPNSPADKQPGQGNGGGSSDSGTGTNEGMGFLRLVLQDAPIDTATNIWVKISDVRVHEACDDGEDCWHTVWENAEGRYIDLLALQAMPKALPMASLPAGKYNQIRMDFIEGWIVFPSTDPTDPKDDKYQLIVPSNEIKTHVHFELEAGVTIKITLDVDAKNSIHLIKKGKKDAYQLRPVVNLVAVEDVSGN